MSATYTPTAKLFHWGLALLIFSLLISGFIMADYLTPPFKFQVYGVHKAVGIIVLTLVVARVLYRSFVPCPGALPMPAWQRWAADVAHGLLYALMVLMPITGWLMSSAGGYPVSIFSLFTVPPLVAPNPELGKLANQLHEAGMWAFAVVLVLHIGGALKHHFFSRDATLTRMMLCAGRCLPRALRNGTEA
jgi:cytochrome b561